MNGASGTDPSDDWGPLVGPWSRYEGNPVLTPRSHERNVQNGPQTVVRFRDRWWMFLQVTAEKQYTKLAVSDDGLTWRFAPPDPVLEADQEWEGGRYSLTKVARVENDEVYLYYFGKQGIEERVGIAISDDLETFRKHPENPILTIEDLNVDGQRVFPDSVVTVDETYYLFYDVGYDYEHPDNPRAYRICVATSDDGVHFRPHPQNPVVEPTPAESWNDGHVCQASVLRIGDQWYMLYSGLSRRADSKAGQAIGLARADSPTGPWEQYPNNPIFSSPDNDDAWDHYFVQHACPVYVDGQWRLYYSGKDGQRYSIGVALREKH